MRVLVCGATGFIGRHIASALRDHGHQVVAASRGGREAVGQEALAVNFMAMTQPSVGSGWTTRPLSRCC